MNGNCCLVWPSDIPSDSVAILQDSLAVFCETLQLAQHSFVPRIFKILLALKILTGWGWGEVEKPREGRRILQRVPAWLTLKLSNGGGTLGATIAPHVCAIGSDIRIGTFCSDRCELYSSLDDPVEEGRRGILGNGGGF